MIKDNPVKKVWQKPEVSDLDVNKNTAKSYGITEETSTTGPNPS
jgi:hypothetical protein